MKNRISSARPRARRLAAVAPLLALSVMTTGCDEEPVAVTLPDLEVQASMTAFADVDPFIGTDETIEIELRNDGGGDVTITRIGLEGGDATDFTLDEAAAGTLAAGGARTVVVGFAPAAEGAKAATFFVESDDPNSGRVEMRVTGVAARFQYEQVDRMGIPALNTVFNHPSGSFGFDKRAYNVVSPEADVATYRDQFIVVLGAVGNGDPEAAADLLLPDELPVSLGAVSTSFATLTGRALADDATDVALLVTVGDPSLQSDNVDANDVPFRAVFPYVAQPHS